MGLKINKSITFDGIETLEAKIEELQEKIKEVKTLADEITSIEITINFQKKY